jgi:hypothetical protein
MDWYIDDYNTIYDREFSSHFHMLWNDILKKYIEEKLWSDLPNKLLNWASIWMEEKHKNFYTIFEMIRQFFNSIDDSKNDTLWIAESVIWTNTYKIYNSMWAIQVWIDKYFWVNKNPYQSDIFIHPWAIVDYKNNFNMSVKEYIKLNRHKFNEMLVA